MNAQPPELPSPEAPPIQPRRWPAFCCGLLLLLAFLSGGGVVSFVLYVQNQFRATVAYDEARVLIEENAALREALGEPVKESGMIAGTLTTTSSARGGGEVVLHIPLEGSKGSGTLEIVAQVETRNLLDSRWVFEAPRLLMGKELIELPTPYPRPAGTVGEIPPYGQALRLLRADARVQELVGAGWDFEQQGHSYGSDGESGDADFQGKIVAKGREISFEAKATQRGGVWALDSLQVIVPFKDPEWQGATPLWRYEGEGVERFDLTPR